MMHGRTPFFDKNRKLMFYRIINTEPSCPPTFSPEAVSCIKGLLRVNEAERLGSGEEGAQEIMDCEFFSTINFDALYDRKIPPPFTPEVINEFDTKYELFSLLFIYFFSTFFLGMYLKHICKLKQKILMKHQLLKVRKVSKNKTLNLKHSLLLAGVLWTIKYFIFFLLKL
jgi:serine/threonine protein kinase